VLPSHDAVVAAVPDYDRYPHLDELETWTDACAAAHPGVEVWPAGASRAFSLADDYDYYEKYGADPAVLLTSGTSTDAHAETVWGCFTLVAEVPYFSSAKIADKSAAGLTRAEAEAQVRDRASQLAAAGGLEPVPIRALVQYQLAALLCTLVAVRERYRPAHPRPSMARISL